MIILNRYKVTDLQKFKRFMFMSILFISILVFASMATINAYSKDIPQFDYISVKEGDTLWSIASDYAENKEIREVIYEISEANNIQNASIYPGDIIKVPLN
ncbi:MAG: LysM peptidoglycan-binding domain-containing protein [Sedimentibacter sp.]